MPFKPLDRTPTWEALVAAAKSGCGFIMLPRREYALVDEDVMEAEGSVAWHRIRSGYVMRHTPTGDEWLHKVVAQHSGMVDHKDRNRLNCQRGNLRPCTLSQNMANSEKVIPSKSTRFKGVHFEKWSGRFKAQCTVNYRNKHLGRFDTEIEAAVAYNEYALKTFGEFALLNVLP